MKQERYVIRSAGRVTYETYPDRQYSTRFVATSHLIHYVLNLAGNELVSLTWPLVLNISLQREILSTKGESLIQKIPAP